VEFFLGRSFAFVFRARVGKVVRWMAGEALLLGDVRILRRGDSSQSLDVGSHLAMLIDVDAKATDV
jgi:hypothetical protein